MMPRFAISVPVGAWHPFLPHVLASLKAQGPDVAVALLDASGDARVKALGDAEAGWLAYRRHGKDKGQSDAILEGWANVDSDWLGWLTRALIHYSFSRCGQGGGGGRTWRRGRRPSCVWLSRRSEAWGRASRCGG